jgi:hypothetical protein
VAQQPQDKLLLMVFGWMVAPGASVDKLAELGIAAEKTRLKPSKDPINSNQVDQSINLATRKNTTNSEILIFGIQSFFRAQTVALDAN